MTEQNTNTPDSKQEAPKRLYAQVLRDGSVAAYERDPREVHDNGKPVYEYVRASVAAVEGVIHWRLKAGVEQTMCGADVKGLLATTLLSDAATCEKCKVAAFGYQIGRTEERAAASLSLPAELPPTPEQIVYNVAQRDPRFRKYLIEQLTALGNEQDKGPLRTLQPLQPTGEQEQYANYRCARCGGPITNGYCKPCAGKREVQCADCLTWFKPDMNHTCRQMIRRNQRSHAK